MFAVRDESEKPAYEIPPLEDADEGIGLSDSFDGMSDVFDVRTAVEEAKSFRELDTTNIVISSRLIIDKLKGRGRFTVISPITSNA